MSGVVLGAVNTVWTKTLKQSRIPTEILLRGSCDETCPKWHRSWGVDPGVWPQPRSSPQLSDLPFVSCPYFPFFLTIYFLSLQHFNTFFHLFLVFSIFHLFTSMYLSCHTHPCTEIIPSLREHFLCVVCFMFVPLIFLLPLSPSSPPFIPLLLFTLVFPHCPDYLPPLLKWMLASRGQEGLGE